MRHKAHCTGYWSVIVMSNKRAMCVAWEFLHVCRWRVDGAIGQALHTGLLCMDILKIRNE